MKRCLLYCLCCVFSIPLFAQEVYDSEIVSRVSYIQIVKGKMIRSDTVVIQINKRMGDRSASIAIPYEKKDNLALGDAWIEDSNGNIVRKLKKNEIKDRSYISNSALYEDSFVKTFDLRHNTYPYKIVYSYKYTTSDFFQIANWQPSYKMKMPIREMKLVLDTPRDYPVRYKQENVAPPVIDTLLNSIRFVWKASYEPLQQEANSPVSGLNLPEINVVPLNYQYAIKGTFDSWQSLGDWDYRLNEKADDLPASEKAKIDQLISGIDDPKEKAKVLYHYLQDHTRYIYVNINFGGHKAYPASYVSANKYGDCKALCNYMKAVLKYAGIKSYYTLIYAGDEVKEIDKSFPAQVFNHIIVTVPFENDTVFLECTNKNIPFGYLGTFTQGREALLVDSDGKSRFITTPSLTPNDVLCVRRIEVDINSELGNVVIDAIQRGDDYEWYTQLSTGINSNDAEMYIRNYMFSGPFELQNFTFHKQPRDVAEINFTAQLKINGVSQKVGNNLLLSCFPHNFSVYEQPEQRTQSLQFDYPAFYTDTIIYKLPAHSTYALPKPVSVESRFGFYKVDYQLVEGELIVVKNILINKGKYYLTDYADFYQFISVIKTNEKKNLYLNKL